MKNFSSAVQGTRSGGLSREASVSWHSSFCNFVVYGALWACQKAGLRIPEDIALAGFDDYPMSSCLHPALTTVRQPLFEMGRLAADYASRSICDASGNHPPQIILPNRACNKRIHSEGAKSMKPQTAKKSTLIELLIVITILMILTTMLLPALSSSRNLAKAIKCTGNMKQIGTAVVSYAGDYNGYVPLARFEGIVGYWKSALSTYLNAKTPDGVYLQPKNPVLNCPSSSISVCH